MKANELQIGDWVNFLIDVEGGDTENDPQNEVYQPMQVDSISSLGDVSSAFYGVINDAAQLQPIPLTSEILEKNGFKREDCDDDIHCRFILIYEGVRFSLLYARSVFQWLGPLDFKYVHELQHALRLCGIEKEIEI